MTAAGTLTRGCYLAWGRHLTSLSSTGSLLRPVDSTYRHDPVSRPTLRTCNPWSASRCSAVTRSTASASPRSTTTVGTLRAKRLKPVEVRKTHRICDTARPRSTALCGCTRQSQQPHATCPGSSGPGARLTSPCEVQESNHLLELVTSDSVAILRELLLAKGLEHLRLRRAWCKLGEALRPLDLGRAVNHGL